MGDAHRNDSGASQIMEFINHSIIILTLCDGENIAWFSEIIKYWYGYLPKIDKSLMYDTVKKNIVNN